MENKHELNKADLLDKLTEVLADNANKAFSSLASWDTSRCQTLYDESNKAWLKICEINSGDGDLLDEEEKLSSEIFFKVTKVITLLCHVNFSLMCGETNSPSVKRKVGETDKLCSNLIDNITAIETILKSERSEMTETYGEICGSDLEITDEQHARYARYVEYLGDEIKMYSSFYAMIIFIQFLNKEIIMEMIESMDNLTFDQASFVQKAAEKLREFSATYADNYISTGKNIDDIYHILRFADTLADVYEKQLHNIYAREKAFLLSQAKNNAALPAKSEKETQSQTIHSVISPVINITNTNQMTNQILFNDVESIAAEIRKEIGNYRLNQDEQAELLEMVLEMEDAKKNKKPTRLKSILYGIGGLLKDFAVGVSAKLIAGAAM